MKYQLKHAVIASLIVVALYLFFCWMCGYNFDTRGAGEGLATGMGIFMAFCPFIPYLAVKFKL